MRNTFKETEANTSAFLAEKPSRREKQRLYAIKMRRKVRDFSQQSIRIQDRVDWYTKRMRVASDPGLYGSAIELGKKHNVNPQFVYAVRESVKNVVRDR